MARVSSALRLPRTVDVLERGIDDGTHIGAQLYASVEGRTLADVALGEARPGVPMTTDTLMIWFSMTKAVTAVAFAQHWERGLVGLDDRVVDHVPEFAGGGKDPITIRHLLTHTAGLRWADGVLEGLPFRSTWEENLATICAAAVEDGWEPGRRAGYHPTSGFFLLGEIVRRLDGRPYDRYVREAVCEPLGMTDSWVGMPPDRYRAYGDRIGVMHNTEQEPRPAPGIDLEETTARCLPGGNGRGPMRELGRLYEMLLGEGALDGTRLLSPPAVSAMTARHRVGMHDETFEAVMDWGLGLAVDTYVMGRHCSRRTFGHGGARSSIAFCDPEHGVVLAVVCNGMCAVERHYDRLEAVSSALYVDLGLAAPDDPGRAKPRPAGGL
jgi:CubicO group peptidase (beta-lactamase class C family)